MAFYFLGDGVTDVPVWFDDEADYAAFIVSNRFAGIPEFDFSTPNGTSVALGAEQFTFDDARWIGLPWLSAYEIVDGGDAWISFENAGLDATATGAIVSVVYSLLAGTATGEVNASAPGATVSEVYSFLPGAASGGVAATAPGAIVSEVYSFIPGSATGQINATAAGAIVSEVYSFLPGAASGGVAAVATGATVSYFYSFLGGLAFGQIAASNKGDDGGSRRRPTVSMRPKVERDIDAVLEIVEAAQGTQRTGQRRKTVKEAVERISVISAPAMYQEALASIGKVLASASRAAAIHEGVQDAVDRAAIELQTVLNEMETRRLKKRREEEILVSWLLN
jgi:hypothetical protein